MPMPHAAPRRNAPLGAAHLVLSSCCACPALPGALPTGLQCSPYPAPLPHATAHLQISNAKLDQWGQAHGVPKIIVATGARSAGPALAQS